MPVDLDRLTTALAGRYTIEREIGRGGMATVYLAEDLKHRREVAIKVLQPELARAIGPERFVQEIEIAAKLTHPNILPLHDSGEAEGLLYYVMPYVDDESLRERMDREPQLPLDDAIGIIRDVAGALSYAHGQGVIHRDIKPENVLLSAGRPVISDFGIARAVDAAGSQRLTETGLTVGSPGYMSPEQAAGDTTLDERSDIYSLGCVVYEMLAGEAPFTGATPQAVLARVLTDPPPSVRTLRPSIPEGVERVVQTALAKIPDDRFKSATDFADSLAEANTAQAIAADARRSRQALRRRSAIGVVAFALLVAAGWWLTTLLGTPAIERLAVLPPTNLMNDPEQEFLITGVHNGLISELQQIGVAVIARTSVMQYEDTDKPAHEIATELGVDALVEPSVLRAGDSVDVEVRLVDGETEEYLANPIVRRGDLRNVQALYRDLTRAIATEIQAALTPQTEARLAAARQVDPEAYEAYIKGQAHYERLTPQDAEAARQYFQAAIDIDPDYAPAHAGLALTWVVLAQMGFMAPGEATPLALAAVNRALEADSILAEVQYASAVVKTWYEWDWDAAEQAFLTAIEINPNYEHARAFYGHFLMTQGKFDEAIEQMELALDLDPFNDMFQALYGMVLVFAQRPDEAIERFELALRTSPNSPLALSGLAGAYSDQGMHQEALAYRNQLYTAFGDEELVNALAAGYADGGFREAMIREAEIQVVRAETTYVAPLHIAGLFLNARDYDRALEWLARGYEEGDPNIPYQHVEHRWDPVRNDPRYQDVMRRLGFVN